MTNTLIVPGHKVETLAQADPQLEAFGLEVEEKHAVRVDASERGLAEELRLEDAEDDDVVELEFSDGVHEWVSVARLRERLAEIDPQLVAGPTVRIPPVRAEAAARGGVDLILKGLKLLNIDPAKKLAGLAVREVVERFEGKLEPGPGVYWLEPDGAYSKRPTTAQLDRDAPYLVFIHGTFSTTKGSFSNLFGTAEWANLCARYGQRILALEHRTLSQSPAENALELAKLLPSGARLHLVTHSRGGLVGELLCRGALTNEDLSAFKNRAKDVTTFKELSRLLREKQFHIDRFVRVACPARGTLLASQRFDLYLSIILNLIGFIPALKASLIYPFAKAVILTLVKERAEPATLPGLEAQMPESPFIRLLNLSGVQVDTDLAVIAGDVQGQGLLGRLKIRATDLFFWEDHDLVVNTASMYDGVARTKGAYFSFQQGPEVNHMNYFGNSASRKLMHTWLTREDGQPIPSEFTKLNREPLPEFSRSEFRAKQADAPVVFVLPGLMATHLKGGDERIWLNLAKLAGGRIERLALDGAKAEDNLVVDDIIVANYQALLTYLANHYEVLPFPYDWRRSVKEAGARLAIEVEAQLRQHDRPVHLLAHSMGGLVARAMIAQRRDVWDRLCRRGGRLVMLGTPNHGAYAVLHLLTGRATVLRLLALLDPSHDVAALRRLFRTFPGLLEMLPDLPGADVWDANWWVSAGLEDEANQASFQRALQAAKQVRDELSRLEIDPVHMCNVAGVAPKTPSSVRVGGDNGLSFKGTTQGDGFVTYKLGELKDVPTWYMSAAHGDMTSHQPAFPALVELLETGKTNQLSATSLARGTSAAFALSDEEPLLFPTERSLVWAALVSPEPGREAKETMVVRVSVVHGSLEYARYPVAIGHYYGDVIIGAEKFLDKQLGGRLSDRMSMNLYSGEAGSAEVVLAPECSPPGGLIIGLGEVGQITPEKVTKGITAVALRLALAVVERSGQEAGNSGWRSAAFSSVLIGTRGGRSLSIESSVSAIVKGAMLANRVLQERKLWDRVRIDEVEFIELYRDIATHAAHAVCDLETHVRMIREENERIEPACYLRVLEGGQLGRPALEYDTGWWRRLQISEVEDKEWKSETRDLQFLMLTDRARAEETLQATQRSLVDNFVKEAIVNAGSSPDLPATLFELLLPNTFKDQAQETANLVLVLDGNAAQYPWEMLAERTQEQDVTPLAIRIGVLRQLKTAQFRPRVQPPRGSNALVIGEPHIGADSSYPPLPGAKEEAEIVVEALEKKYNYKVTPLIGEDANALAIINALFAREYRILHIAGHGIYVPNHPAKSGVVIGKGIYLTAAEIRQLRVVPELVFLNCCHLAKVDSANEAGNAAQEPTQRAWNKLAASIAEELIKIGVRAVVAAGWAVNDGAAKTFATEFYQQMLAGGGQQFGYAVHEARKQTYNLYHSYTNTWGAYQCYGDPGFMLNVRAQAAPSTALRHVALHEIIRELEDIKERAAEIDPIERKADLERVRELEQTIRAEWRTSNVFYHLGAAFGELGAFEEAVRTYRKALDLWGDDVPIGIVGQLANLEARYAEQLRKRLEAGAAGQQAAASAKLIKELLEKAKQRLTWVLHAGETPERLALVGSCYKRIALATRDNDREKALEQAEYYYAEAHKLSQSASGIDPYHALNWATCHFLRDSGKDEKVKKGWLDLIRLSEQAAVEREANQPSFWNRITAPDAALLRSFVNNDLGNREDEIMQLYKRAFGSRVSVRERSSVIEHIDFLIEMLNYRELSALESLRRLRDALAE